MEVIVGADEDECDSQLLRRYLAATSLYLPSQPCATFVPTGPVAKTAGTGLPSARSMMNRAYYPPLGALWGVRNISSRA